MMFTPKGPDAPRIIAGGILAVLLGAKGKYEKKMVQEAIAITKDLLDECDRRWPPS